MKIIEVRDSIAGLMSRTGNPLSDYQKLILAGALAVWLKKVYDKGFSDGGPSVTGQYKPPQ